MTSFLPINFIKCFGCSKNRLIKMVPLSTHNLFFILEIRKTFFIAHSYLEACNDDAQVFKVHDPIIQAICLGKTLGHNGELFKFW